MKEYILSSKICFYLSPLNHLYYQVQFSSEEWSWNITEDNSNFTTTCSRENSAAEKLVYFFRKYIQIIRASLALKPNQHMRIVKASMKILLIYYCHKCQKSSMKRKEKAKMQSTVIKHCEEYE